MNKTKKIFISLLILSLFVFCFNIKLFAVSADDEPSNEINSTSENSTNTTNESENDTDNSSNSSNNEISEDSSNEVRTTSTPTTNTSSQTGTQTISSYSTVSSIPEANLGLNNILNILLIAIGILMILLGIAILIRLKNEK